MLYRIPLRLILIKEGCATICVSATLNGAYGVKQQSGFFTDQYIGNVSIRKRGASNRWNGLENMFYIPLYKLCHVDWGLETFQGCIQDSYFFISWVFVDSRYFVLKKLNALVARHFLLSGNLKTFFTDIAKLWNYGNVFEESCERNSEIIWHKSWFIFISFLRVLCMKDGLHYWSWYSIILI